MSPNNAMRIITINVSEKEVAVLDKLVKFGFFPSRSEGLRRALSRMLEEKSNLLDRLTNFMSKTENFEELLQTLVTRMQSIKQLPNKKKSKVKIKAEELVSVAKVDGVKVREYRNVDVKLIKKLGVNIGDLLPELIDNQPQDLIPENDSKLPQGVQKRLNEIINPGKPLREFKTYQLTTKLEEQ